MRKLITIISLFVISSAIGWAQCTVSNVTTATFATTFSSAAGGSTICLKAGNYGAFSGGSKSSMVTIQPDAANGGTQANVIFGAVTFGGGTQNVTMKNMTIAGGTVGTGRGSGPSPALHIHFVQIIFTQGLCINTPTNVNQDTLVDQSFFGPDWQGGQSCTEGRLGVDGQDTTHNVVNGVVISNTLFGGPLSGSNGADGIQIEGSAYGTVIGPGNTFQNIQESHCGVVHCDSIQFYGAHNTTITGNFFSNVSDTLMTPDCNGTPFTFTDNVSVMESGSATGDVYVGGGNGDVFNHNTFSTQNGGTINFNNNSCGTSSNETITNNVMPSPYNNPDGSGTGFVVNHNLCQSSTHCGGTGALIGTGTFVGGANPTTYTGFQLTSGSLGHNAASDSLDMGVRFSGTVQAAQPTCSPVSGTANPTPVTLATTSGSVICYNFTGSPATNGSTGCTTGTKYTGAITIGVNETLSAIAGGTGFTDSTIRSCTYTVTAPGAPVLLLGPITMNGHVKLFP